MIAEIIAVGSELLTPFRQDTNSLYLTEKLNSIGVEVGFKTIVGDAMKDLVRVATTALARADILIFSGGLGPTEDDLTREAVAEALGLTLHRDGEILSRLEKRFADLAEFVSAAIQGQITQARAEQQAIIRLKEQEGAAVELEKRRLDLIGAELLDLLNNASQIAAGKPLATEELERLAPGA